jgi:ribonuclease E
VEPQPGEVEAAEPTPPQPANDRAPAKQRQTRAAATVRRDAPEAPVLEREDQMDSDDGSSGPPRRGWWQRTFGA